VRTRADTIRGPSKSEANGRIVLGDLRVSKLLRMMITVGKTMPSAPSPSHHHFYRWYKTIPKWVVDDIVLPPLSLIIVDSY
jgi:hypothetical protein